MRNFFIQWTWLIGLGTFQVHAAKQGLTIQVHEWGTFTTLSNSQGMSLPGLFIDASPLPSFVETLPFFAGAPAPISTLKGGQNQFTEDSILAAKWKNTKVKMETPILYFYHPWPQSLPIKVKVSFPGGTIHQFFPPRQGGEENPTGNQIDFAEKGTGSIEWNAEILPDTIKAVNDERLTYPDGGHSQEWLAPRLPHSNLVKAGGAVESYLFYRGLGGNLKLPLNMRFTEDSILELSNSANDSIQHLVIYDQVYSNNLVQPGAIWWSGTLAPHEVRRIPLEAKNLPQTREARDFAFENMKTNLRNGLIQAGLTGDEATAMLNTWDRSYWGDERGFKVFWIVPQNIIDSLLPLQIENTSPEGCGFMIKRAFIARSEILMPAYEREIKAGMEMDPADRHRMAYRFYQSAPIETSALRTLTLQGKRLIYRSAIHDVLGRFNYRSENRVRYPLIKNDLSPK